MRAFLFFLPQFYDSLDFPSERLVFNVTFPAPFFPPLHVSLSLASGQPVSFSEWLSPLRLRGLVKLCTYSPSPGVTGDAHSPHPSAALLLPDQSEPDNKSQCTPLFATSPPASLLVGFMLM